MLQLRRIKRFGTLSAADRTLFIRAYLWLGLIAVGLRALGFKRLIQRMQQMELAAVPVGEDASVAGPAALEQSRRYAHWLLTASRFHPLRPQCLQRSLVLHRWLRQAGLPSELRVGVRKQGSELKAHAWIELEGQIVNDWPESVAAFTPLTGVRAAQLGAQAWGVW